MKERFEGTHNRTVLLEILCEQKLVLGDLQPAERIADAGELIEFTSQSVVIEQRGHDNKLYFILTGAVDIDVNGRKVATRRTNDHIGEMAVLQSTQARSATILAN